MLPSSALHQIFRLFPKSRFLLRKTQQGFSCEKLSLICHSNEEIDLQSIDDTMLRLDPATRMAAMCFLCLTIVFKRQYP